MSQEQKRPSFQFYPGDWLNDSGLRLCSVGARGMWMDMICFMHQSKPYGCLKVGNKVILPANLARMIGATLSEAEGWLEELESFGVFDRGEDGVIMSRRMIRDERIRVSRAEGGVKGGNPKLKDNHKDNHKDNLNGNLPPTPSSSSSSSSSFTSAKPKRERKKSSKPRERNLLFDAVAEVTCSDPVVSGSYVAKIANLLKESDPPYTPDEVREFSRRAKEFMPWREKDKVLTINEIEKFIGLLRGKVIAEPPKLTSEQQSKINADLAERRKRGELC